MSNELTSHHGNKLKAYLKDILKLKLEDFGGPEYLHKSRAATFAFLRKSSFSKSDIALVCQLLPLSPAFFHKPEDYFSTKYNEQASDSSVVDFSSLHASLQEGKGFKGFIEEYYTKIIKYLDHAENCFITYSYLSKVRGFSFLGMWKTTRTYYRRVESKIENSTDQQLHYTHILALPLQYQTDKPIEGPSHFNELVKTVIKLMFFETFTHFANSFNNFERRFSLYVIATPTRLYSYKVIDKKFAISEYDRYDNGIASTSLLYINEARNNRPDDPTGVLIRDYLSDLKEIKSESNPATKSKITKESFIERVNILFDEITAEVNQLIDKRKEDEAEKIKEPNNSKKFAEILLKINTTTDLIREKKREQQAIKKKRDYLIKLNLL